MCRYFFGCLLSLYFTVGYASLLSTDKNSYGPYTLTVRNIVACNDDEWQQRAYSYAKGAISEFYLRVIQDTVKANFTMFKTCDLARSRSKIDVALTMDNVKKTVFNYAIKNTCQHFALGTALKMLYNLKDCLLRKGVYTMAINMTDIAHLFTGSSFFYGAFEYKTEVRCRSEMLFCILASVLYEKTK